MNKKNYLTWFVPLDIAKELKDIGFKEPCLFSYSEGVGITAMVWGSLKGKTEFSIKDFVLGGNSPGSPFTDIPTWEQVFAWFRSKGYESYIKLESKSYIDEGNYYYFEVTNPNLIQISYKGDFDNYEEAREELVYKLIEIYKSEQNENLHLRKD